MTCAHAAFFSTGRKQKRSLPTISGSEPALVAAQKTERPETRGAQIPRKGRRRRSTVSGSGAQRHWGQCLCSPATSCFSQVASVTPSIDRLIYLSIYHTYIHTYALY